MSSTGMGRQILSGWVTVRSLRTPTFQETATSGLEDITGDYWWGGYPPEPTQIPYTWLTPPARFRSDQPRNVATVTRTGGSSARAVDTVSVAAVGERPFTASLNSQVLADPQAYATWVIGNYADARQRMPQLALNLIPRTATESWLILEREIGDRISIVDGPEPTLTVATDLFERTLSDTWGSEPLSGRPYDYNVSPVGVFSVAGSVPQARINTATTGQLYYGVVDTGHISHRVQVRETLPVVPTGAPISLRVVGRWSDANNYYETELVVFVGGAVNIMLSKRINGSRTQLTSGVSAGTHAAGNRWVIRMDVTNAVISAKAWNPSSSGEPDDWQVTATDTDLTAGTFAGVGCRREGGNLDGALDIAYDTLSITSPNPEAWPAGVTELVIEGIANVISGDIRGVGWNTAPVIGASPGVAGPWFRADESRTDTGSDLLAF